MKFLEDNVVLNACASRNGSSGLPEKIKSRRFFAWRLDLLEAAQQHFYRYCLDVATTRGGGVCQLPTQSTDPRNLRRLFSTDSIIPRTPQVKCFSLASLSGGGSPTSVTHRTPAASFNSLNASPPISIPGPTVRQIVSPMRTFLAQHL